MWITNCLYSSHLNQAHLKPELSHYFFCGAATQFLQGRVGKEIKGFSTLVAGKESVQAICSHIEYVFGATVGKHFS